MSKKLGNVWIGIIMLTFMIGGLSQFVSEADASIGVNSGIVGGLSGLAGSTLNQTQQAIIDQTQKLENPVDFSPTEGNLIESRGADSSGLLNRENKNIIIGFINEVSNKLGLDSWVIMLAISLVSGICFILFLRFFWGDSRI